MNTPQIISSANAFECPVKHIPIKRIFDITFSLSVLVLLAPFLLIVAGLVKVTSRGPIFYSQERIGRGGKPFRCYKFRTMRADAEEQLQKILNTDPLRRHEWETSYKLKNDPRITPIGSFLRKTSLDEFPQFFNVLKGDLSVVGPRPVVRDEIEKFYGVKAHLIFSFRPGITGIWQVSGRSDTNYDIRVAYDEFYAANQSLWLDLKIIAQTVPAMLSSRGAY